MSFFRTLMMAGGGVTPSTLLDGLLYNWEASEGPGNWIDSIAGLDMVYTAGANAAVRAPFKRGFGTRSFASNSFLTERINTPGWDGEIQSSITISKWWSLDATASTHGMIGQWEAVTRRRFRVYYQKSTESFICNISSDGSNTAATLTVPYAESLLLKETTLITFFYEVGVRIGLKIDNHYQNNAITWQAYTGGIYNNASNLSVIGGTSDGGSLTSVAYHGLCRIWSRILTTDELDENWNNGRGIRYPFTPTSQANLGANRFSILHIQDTQHLVTGDARRTKQWGWWIADNMEELGYTMAIHVGDVRHKTLPTDPDVPAEWVRFHEAIQFSIDKGLEWRIVYGNHDMNFLGLSNTREENMTEFRAAFPQTFHTNQPGWNGDHYDSTIDRGWYDLQTLGGVDYLILGLEAVPSDDLLTWAAGIVAANPTRKVIYVSHQILSQSVGQSGGDTIFMDANDNTMTHNDYNSIGSRNGGTAQYNAILKPYANSRFFLCGHDNTNKNNGEITLVGDQGNTILGILRNMQGEDVSSTTNGWVCVWLVNHSTNELQLKTFNIAQQTYNWTTSVLTTTPEEQNKTISFE